MPRSGLTEGLGAFMERGASGHDVIDEQDGLSLKGFRMGNGKGPAQVGQTFFSGQRSLGNGLPCSSELTEH